MIGPLVWAGLKKLDEDTNDKRGMLDIVSTLMSNLPPLSAADTDMGNPMLQMVWDGAFISTGGNPPDFFRRKGKFREDDEFKAHPWQVYFKNLLGAIQPFYSPDVQMEKGEPADAIRLARQSKAITSVLSVTGNSKIEANLRKRIKEGAEQKLKADARLAIKGVSPEAYSFMVAGSEAAGSKKSSRSQRDELRASSYRQFENTYWNPGGHDTGMQAALIQALKRKDDASLFSAERKAAKSEVKRIAGEAAAILNRQKALQKTIKLDGE
jgi:hypothetical protein